MAFRPLRIAPLLAAAGLAACQPGEGTGNQSEAANQAAPLPAEAGGAPAATAGGAEMLANKTIADNLSSSPGHSTLMRAVEAAGLRETLAGGTPYTIFAPVDSAFQKLPAGSVEALMKPEGKGQLTALLTYHAVPGVVAAADLARAVESAGGTAELATLGGSNLKISRDGEAIVITDAKGGQSRITQADMVQSNGVVHVVDSVLMPG